MVVSVTMKSAAADGDSMDHYLVVSVTIRSTVADGDSIGPFSVFLSPRSLLQQMVIAWTCFRAFLSL